MEKSPDVIRSLLHSAADLRALSRYLLEVLELQRHERELRQDGVILQLVDDAASTLRNQIDRLDEELRSLGHAESALRSSTGQLAGAFIGFFSKNRPHEPSKMIRDDVTLLSLAITGYLTLHTSAVALRQTSTADLAMGHYREVSALHHELLQQLPRLVVADLSRHFGGLHPGAARVTQELASEVTPIQQASLAATA